MSKDIWKAKSLDYDSLRFSFFIIMYSHISSVVLCLMFAHISSYFLTPQRKNNIMITANIIQQYNMKSLRVEETQNTLIISTNIQEMLSSFVMFPAPQKKESPNK